MSIYIIGLLFGSLLLGMPVAYVLGVTSLFIMIDMGNASLFPLIPMRFFNSINLFPLMAMPLFILAGEIMNKTGITSRVIDFSISDGRAGTLSGRRGARSAVCGCGN